MQSLQALYNFIFNLFLQKLLTHLWFNGNFAYCQDYRYANAMYNAKANIPGNCELVTGRLTKAFALA